MKPNYLTILQIISLLWSLLIQARAFQRCNQILQILTATHSTNTAKIHHFNSENRIKPIEAYEKQLRTPYYSQFSNNVISNIYILYMPLKPPTTWISQDKYSAINIPSRQQHTPVSATDTYPT